VLLGDEFLDDLTADIVDALYAIKDVSMRTHSLISKIFDMNAGTIAEIFHRIIEKARANDARYCCAMVSLIDIPTITRHLGNPLMSEIYTYCRENNLESVINLLIRPEPLKSYEIIEIISEDDTPAGVKVTQSKIPNPNAIDKLINDGNPMVVRNLLRNPRLTESHVLKIASRRPVSAEILKEVYLNKKWISRYTVKRALVFNPYCPPEMGLKLVNFLMVQDLRQVRNSDQLHETLREVAANRLAPAKGHEGDTG
jgi:hypothetical protein